MGGEQKLAESAPLGHRRCPACGVAGLRLRMGRTLDARRPLALGKLARPVGQGRSEEHREFRPRPDLSLSPRAGPCSHG